MARLDLPLRSVQSFMAVVRMKSFTEAAVVLNMTQPAVTQNVLKLEERLGCRLLDRNGNSFVLTDAGKRMLPEFQRIEDDIDRVFQRAREIGSLSSELVKIAAPNSLIAHIIAPTLASMAPHRAYFSLMEVDDETVYELVRSGDVDIAITSIQGEDAKLDASHLITDLPCVVFPAGHPLETAPSLNLEILMSQKFIRLPIGTIANFFADELCILAKREIEYSIEATRLLSLKSLIEQKLGVALLPGLSAKLLSGPMIGYRVLDLNGARRNSQIIASKKSSGMPSVAKAVAGFAKHAASLSTLYPDICPPA